MKFDELQAKIANAKDAKSAADIIAEYNKGKADERKAEILTEQKEATALAGAREKLAIAIWTAVKAYASELAKVKAKGFTYKLDTDELQYKSVELTVPTVKRAGGGGGGRKGNLQEQFDSIRGRYADAEAEYAEALDKDKTVSNQGYSYNVKKRYVKKAIADGLLTPAS